MSEIKENPDSKVEKTEGGNEANDAYREEKLGEMEDSIEADLEEDSGDGLSVEEKNEIKEDTGWSDEIVDSVKTKEEAEVYKNANLEEKDVDGRPCLVRSDIDGEQKDEFGRTNKERMADGHPPLTKSGETVELHHIGQRQDSPFAELTTQEHRGKGNDTVLHDKTKESEIDRSEYAKERKSHWESRSEDI